MKANANIQNSTLHNGLEGKARDNNISRSPPPFNGCQQQLQSLIALMMTPHSYDVSHGLVNSDGVGDF